MGIITKNDEVITLMGGINMDYDYVWRIKTWEFENVEQSIIAETEMEAWIEKWKDKYQIEQIFVNNAWAVKYRSWYHYC